MKNASLAITLLLMCPPAGAVEVLRQTQPGPDRLQAEIRIHSGIATILAALETACAVRHWLPDAREVTVLQRANAGHTRVRMVTDLPWPWNDRAAVLEFHRQRPGPDRARIHMTAVKQGPIPEGTVRITQASATWRLHDRGDHVLLRYQQQFHPAGAVPQWLADRVAELQVDDALENLRQLVEGQARTADACHWRPADTGGGGDGQSGDHTPELP